jgi:RNA polymerase-binding transcription factor DksA
MNALTIRERLRAERQATIVRIEEMNDDFDDIVDSSVNANTDDEHDPEGVTVAFERAQVAAFLAQAQAHLDDVDRALARLAAGSYSQCELCSAAISSERLAARPVARTCFACAASSGGPSGAIANPPTPKIAL